MAKWGLAKIPPKIFFLENITLASQLEDPPPSFVDFSALFMIKNWI